MPKYISTPAALATTDQVLAAQQRKLAAEQAAAEPRLPHQLGLCLDISGSMTSLVSSVVRGYNAILASLPETQVTVAMFGSEIHFPVRRSSAGALSPMTDEQYQLEGSTALLDGLGDLIGELSKIYDPPPKLRKPAVLIALLTDGYENDSHRYTLDDIKHMVAYRRVACSWQFIYLSSSTGSDPTYGLKLGIPPSNIASFSDPADLASLLERLKAAAGAFYLGDRNFARLLLKEGKENKR